VKEATFGAVQSVAGRPDTYELGQALVYSHGNRDDGGSMVNSVTSLRGVGISALRLCERWMDRRR